MVGRAILGHPKLLLVDEPTEGLAPSIVMLQGRFQRTKQENGAGRRRAEPALVCAIANKVYALKDGVVAELADRASINPESAARNISKTGSNKGARELTF